MSAEDGNAFAGRARRSMLQHGLNKLAQKKFADEATAKNYDYFIQTCIRYFDCDGEI